MAIKVKLPYLFACMLLIIISIIADCNIFLFFSLLIIIAAVGVLSFDFSKHIFLTLFLIAFYVFLLGGLVAEEFFGVERGYIFSDKVYNHINICILVSLVSILAGYFAGYRRNLSVRSKGSNLNGRLSQSTDTIRYISKIFFFVLCIPWYAVLAEQVVVVQTGGYLEYYSFESQLPGIVQNLAFVCIFALCTYLSTYPDKKDARIPLAIVMAYAVISLMVGRRIFFVVYFLLCLGYVLCRNFDKENNEQWISKKIIIIMIALSPVLLVALYSIRYIRYGREIEASSFAEALLGFFDQQGGCANLIGYGKVYESGLSKDIYSLYDTIRYMRKSPVARLFGVDYNKFYTGTREYLAIHSGSYARIISYLRLKGAYLYGYGLGSCYIAELYHDFGYFGVVIGNLIYGFIIGRVMVLEKGRLIRNAIGLILFYRILMVPRYNFDYVFSFLYSLSFWAFAVIMILALLFFNWRRKKRMPV